MHRVPRLYWWGLFLCLAPSVCLALGICLAPRVARAENWPGWRGPRGDGTSAESKVPVRWHEDEDPAKNVGIAWKVELPGTGHASPIVWDDSIFIVSCREETRERLLICLDREGKTRWQTVVLKSPLEKKHHLNSFASSTPATDGKLVYTTFLDRSQMTVAAFDFQGQEQWRVQPGVFSSVHGYCSCPVVFDNLLIVNGDHDGESYIVALNCRTGETVWKTPRENRTRSYCTPIVREIDGRQQLILSGSLSVCAYDPRTGERIWNIRGPTEQFVASMVFNGDLLFMTAGFPEHHILAIRPTGKGDVTDTHIAWRTQENCSYVPSPIWVGDYFLAVSDEGVASCFRARDGERMWKNRLGAHFSASLVAANGLAYFLSDEGETTVVEPGPKYKEIARNSLLETCFASPAIGEGRLLIRGEKHLYCLQNR